MSNYPSVITTFTNPAATDKLNSPSHSGIEVAQNAGLTQIQTYLGVTGDSSVAGTLVYQVQSPDSNGGGHVQTANKGGTGQTSYTKGDLLVGSSSSFVSKLGVGSNGMVLLSDSSQQSGVGWGSAVKFAANASVITVLGTTAETSVLSVSIPASILSTGNVLRTTLFVGGYTVGGASDTLILKANFGSNSIGSVLLIPSGASTSSVFGKIEYTLFGNALDTAQRGELSVNIRGQRVNILQPSVLGIDAFASGTTSVAASSSQTLGITAKWGASIAGSRLDINEYLVEKLV